MFRMSAIGSLFLALITLIFLFDLVFRSQPGACRAKPTWEELGQRNLKNSKNNIKK